jgi:Ni/Co efflux regulator RcnB
MKIKKIIAVALACTSLVATTSAFADGRGHGGGHGQGGHGHGGYSHGGGHGGYGRGDRGHWGGHDHYRHYEGPRWHGGGPRYYGRPHGGWVVGNRLPGYYPGSYYVVNDWRARNLYAPRPGYQWVQSDGDYLLVGIATGVILGTILAH